MKITFIGHAGFCVETDSAIIIMDPWLSPTGAFDASWFQFPRNHHLAAYVQEKLADARKARFVYVSHEHKDHFDLEFLESLRCRDFRVLVPEFRRPYLRSFFDGYRCLEVVGCRDGQEICIPGGMVKLLLDDSEFNRDSGILVTADGQSFLNLNDCRSLDSLSDIACGEDRLDVFTCQFSGAGWHPTCYEYSRPRYEAISRKKVLAKFNAVAQTIRTLQPRVYIPSAGPPCFLDPALLHLNFESVNIFPRAPQFLAYLDRCLDGRQTMCTELMPGDVLDSLTGTVIYRSPERVSQEGFADYLRRYAAAYEGFFAERQRMYVDGGDRGDLLERLRGALAEKLSLLTMRDRIKSPLYFRLEDVCDKMLRVDFPGQSVAYVDEIAAEDRYVITAPSWEIARVLDGKITWDDFSLTFRMRLDREPDVFQTLLQGFLRLEPEDMNWFCAKLLDIERNQERILVEAGGKRYVVNRYCPHEGGDLSRGWVEDGRFLTCPRHQWQFDLENDGVARGNEGSVHAMCLDDD